MNDQTCGNCRHAIPVDPTVHMWGRYGFNHQDYVHCPFSKSPKTSVIGKGKCCTWKPSKFEPANG